MIKCVNIVNDLCHDDNVIRFGHVTGVQTCALPIYELAVYAPAQGRLFEREPTRFSMPLPRDGARARVLDLDHGLAQELVLPFDAQDDAAHRNQVLLLNSYGVRARSHRTSFVPAKAANVARHYPKCVAAPRRLEE